MSFCFLGNLIVISDGGLGQLFQERSCYFFVELEFMWLLSCWGGWVRACRYFPGVKVV